MLVLVLSHWPPRKDILLSAYTWGVLFEPHSRCILVRANFRLSSGSLEGKGGKEGEGEGEKGRGGEWRRGREGERKERKSLKIKLDISVTNLGQPEDYNPNCRCDVLESRVDT